MTYGRESDAVVGSCVLLNGTPYKVNKTWLQPLWLILWIKKVLQTLHGTARFLVCATSRSSRKTKCGRPPSEQKGVM